MYEGHGDIYPTDLDVKCAPLNSAVPFCPTKTAQKKTIDLIYSKGSIIGFNLLYAMSFCKKKYLAV